MAKNTGKVRGFCQSGKVGTLPGGIHHTPWTQRKTPRPIACWDTHALPVNRMTDRCKNTTLPQT